MAAVPFEATLRATVVPAKCSREQFAAFILVARQFDLNPITKEIYAFPAKGGGIQPIVSIDGWMKLMNSHPQFDGIEFEDHFDGDNLRAITARIYRKDRTRPIVVTEYLSECRRDTEPWNKWPTRMLRHKTAIQGARYAFGFSGIIDPDEYDRFGAQNVTHIRPDAAPQLPPPEPLPAEDMPPAPPEPVPAGPGPMDGPPPPPPEPEASAMPPMPPEPAEAPGPADGENPFQSPSEVLEQVKEELRHAKSQADVQAIRDEYASHPALSFPGDQGDLNALCMERMGGVPK
ncbi:MAG: RecT family recombinase [Pseudomonadota bacterium]